MRRTRSARTAGLQQNVWISLAIIIGAQINFNLFHTDFKISIGSTLNEKVNIIKNSFIVRDIKDNNINTEIIKEIQGYYNITNLQEQLIEVLNMLILIRKKKLLK